MKSNYQQAIQALTSIMQEQETALAATQSDNASLRDQVDLLRLELMAERSEHNDLRTKADILSSENEAMRAQLTDLRLE